MTKTCASCGKPFEAKPSRGRMYCSKRCYGDAKTLPKLEPRLCGQCGSAFVPTRHQFTNANYQGTYCSVACSNRARKQPLTERWAAFVARAERTETGCLLWPGGRDQDGYGVIVDDGGHQQRVHRLSYERHRGPLPPGMKVLHTCDTPPCFELTHLFAGTSLDNNRDMVEKGRARYPGPANPPRGETHWKTKLTAEIVVALRRRAAGGETQTALAAEYGVDQSAVSSAIRRRTWKHVP